MGTPKRIPRFGVELEGFVVRQSLIGVTRVNIPEELGLNESNDFRFQVPGGGFVGTDNGYNQLEISVDPCASIEDLRSKLEKCIETLPKEWTIYWTGVDPLTETPINLPACPWTPKPRYHAIREVVASECPKLYPEGPDSPKMDWMSAYAATHIHFEVDPSSREGLLLMNFLNNHGPKKVRRPQDPERKHRLTNAWVGWGDKRRLPDYRWFQSIEEMEQTWKETPRLIRKNENGIWVPDHREGLLEPGNLEDEGCVWWGCRPRWSLGTIEFRWLNSMKPSILFGEVSRWLRLAERILETGGSNTRIYEESEWRAVMRPLRYSRGGM